MIGFIDFLMSPLVFCRVGRSPQVEYNRTFVPLALRILLVLNKSIPISKLLSDC